MKLKHLLTLFLLPALGFCQPTVNVYNWANYLPESILTEFTQKTGIVVHYAQYDSNEMLYAQLKGNPNAGYDVIFPSSYYVKKMAREKMLLPLNKRRIPHMRQLRRSLMNRSFDRGNRYSVPYIWGLTGITYNDHYHHRSELKHWSDLWKPQFHNQLLLLNDSREAFGIALIRLGYSINDRNPQHIKQAYHLLQKLMPNVKVINSVASHNLYLDEDVTAGLGWSGNIMQVHLENPHVKFIYPKPYAMMWIDCMAVPAHAPHPDAAMRFIDFILSPRIAAKISSAFNYPPANPQAMRLLSAKKRHNPIINPPASVLKNAKMQQSVGKAIKWYTYYWQRLKLST